MKRIPLIAMLSYTTILLASMVSCVSQYSDEVDKTRGGSPSLSERRQARIEAWSKEWAAFPSFEASYSPAYDAAFAASAGRQFAFDPSDDYWGLPRTEGYDLVAAYCSACHSLEIVMQQKMTPDRWRYTLNWMSEKQGMAPLPPDEFAAIERYLNRYFSSGPGAAGFE